MTQPQILSVLLVAGMMAAFLWGRLRYDIVAMLALLMAVALGLVPATEAFKGFSDDIVIIVGSALVLSAAVARSRIIERLFSKLGSGLSSMQLQVPLLVFIVAVMSAIIKNIGALAMMLPIAYQLARKSGTSPSVLLMPMAFASLLGGIVTLVGTSPNVIVARVRQELGGEPFRMFDFAPVGIVVAVAGCLFLSLGYRLLPRDRRGAVSLDQAIDIKDYLTEAKLREKSPLAGKTVADLKAIGGDAIEIVSILRNERRVQAPLPDASLKAGDILLLRGDAAVLERVVAEGGLDLAGKDRPTQKEDALDPDRIAEAIIGPDSTLIGQSAGDIALHSRFGINMIAISRSGERFSQRLRDIRLRAGDIVVIQGDEKLLPEKLSELSLLPLADRLVPLGSTRRVVLTVTIVLAAIIALAAGLAPVPLVFFAAAVLLIALRCVPLREAYHSIDAPILLMLAALIPVSDSLRTTGATDLFASWLAMIGGGLPGWASVALILVAAMAVTPFLNNAATVLVMAPIGAGFAKNLGYNPDAFLMAVAIGAACDFLTPIGHQCNTLVMGPGGYRFSDYARLGAPLSLLVILLAVPMILLVWPLR
ncbi:MULTISPECIES: SLC13 family permease [Bosea]|uniref:SLC13 family permease n=1 Tax=Bosea TaxID=85413 RepID=UPI00214FB1C3|nr:MULTISPECIES: SLC13 family permease [Bosea]MCR4521431.1 SLC13 family permease [Bosea sp. 47.2.35]MDR6826857.1 di/tricarboxylate transporter [Bosea robiniae]MDR6893567.1 di/tricarboxylate transporter [Bosea sp. BE109]MDR7136734.1 di/tricarboxylate transporter [Bosea sp. BE168]MDR7173433.1 di/tricarboxylate transporter [Bosea sp. BE271]